MLIYLHGFRSSPASEKAQALTAYLAARGEAHRLWIPALPPAPHEAIALVEGKITELRTQGITPVLAGSSLGGYYCTFLAERHKLRAALVNPAARAPQDLSAWTGWQTNLHTGERFWFGEDEIAQLRALEVPVSDPSRYWLLLEEGDEILDYRDALAKYVGARITCLPDGNHSFTRWQEYLPALRDFAFAPAA